MALRTLTETDVAEMLRYSMVTDTGLEPAEDTLLASVLAIKTYIDDQVVTTVNAALAAAVLTDNAIVRGDGGIRGVQDSGVLIDDSDNVSAIADLDMTGDLTVDGDVLVGGSTTSHTLSSNGQTITIIGTDTTLGLVEIGVNDTVRGALRLMGHATGQVLGGIIQLRTSADHDGTINQYLFTVTSDDLLIGPSNDSDSLTYDGGAGTWNFTGANGVVVANDLDVTGDITVANGNFVGNADEHERIVFRSTGGGGEDIYSANALNITLNSTGDVSIPNGTLDVGGSEISDASGNVSSADGVASFGPADATSFTVRNGIITAIS